jgi:uncharacterized membrane-anchored protein YjiN (DUF445 family)
MYLLLEKLYHSVEGWRKEWRESHRSDERPITRKDLAELKAEILMTVTEALAAFDTQMTTFNDAQDTAITDLEADVKNLNDQIAALQNSPGQITASDQAILDKIQARASTVATKLAALDALTPPVVPTTP